MRISPLALGSVLAALLSAAPSSVAFTIRPSIVPSTASRRQCSLRMSAVEEDTSSSSSSSSSPSLSPLPFFASVAASVPANGHAQPQPHSKPHSQPHHGKKGRSATEIATELNSGVTLEGGATIDFGGAKDSSSKAERALMEAREAYLTSLSSSAAAVRSGGDRLMGINDEVVAEVGREIGTFAAKYGGDAAVQRCAEWIRSNALEGMFDPLSPSSATVEGGGKEGGSDFTDEEVATFHSLLDEAYAESGLVTEAFAKTFYLGTQLLPEPARKAIWAVYVWCRRTDEIVDAPRSPDDVDMLTDLSKWEIRLERLFQYGEVVDALDLPLLDIKAKYASMDIQPYLDMVRGMLMDIPDLGQDRYDTFEELHLYCYRVAGTVGLMSMPVFGCAEGYTDEQAKEPALSLGVAFQLTNILRDVGEDATKRGRIYLPKSSMSKFDVTEDQIFSQTLNDNYIDMMKYEIDRARMYYDRARRGVPMLSAYSRLPVQASLDCYAKILDKIEENGYDNLTKRAYAGKWEKLAEIPFSWYRTQELSKVLPLPWDDVDVDEPSTKVGAGVKRE